jgi:hypothetical protein
VSEESQRLIAEECDRIKEMLLEKNRRYGDSALVPMRVFSRASPEEQIRVRLDDKLSRMARGAGELSADEDTLFDFIGYAILLRVAKRRASDSSAE